jgi:hypothetical protein
VKNLLSQTFSENILAFFRRFLTSTYFSAGGRFYEQTGRMAMGSRPSAVIANFFMKEFEERALAHVTHQPLCWFRYVDDTFIILPHGTENIERLLDNFNEFHRYTQSTIEMEMDGHLPFIDIDIRRRTDGFLGHEVYRKPTHTYLYLNPRSHYILPTYKPFFEPWCTEPGLCMTKTSLHNKLDFLKTTF